MRNARAWLSVLFVDLADWPQSQSLEDERLVLEPLRVEHAEELAPLLDDPALHTFIGGRPAGREELRERYARQVAGRSADGTECWLNWVVRRRDGGQAVGFVQATVTEQHAQLAAELAWVVAVSQQGHGYAREAAQLMTAWLREHGVTVIRAHIHPDHRSSGAVARSIGLTPTDTLVDGELRWQG